MKTEDAYEKETRTCCVRFSPVFVSEIGVEGLREKIPYKDMVNRVRLKKESVRDTVIDIGMIDEITPFTGIKEK